MNQRTLIRTIFGVCMAAIILATVPAPALAFSFPQDLLAQLVPCGSPEKPCDICDIFVLGQNVMKFIFVDLAAPLAVIMLIYAGFLMMNPFGGGASPTQYQRGKKVLYNTLIGLALIFFSWVIIDTIIKAISEGKSYLKPWEQIQCMKGPATGIGPVQPVTSSFNPTNAITDVNERAVRTRLGDLGIGINKNPCPAGTSFRSVAGGCTSVAGMPTSVIDGLGAIKQSCNAPVTVTGGTESGHQTHGANRPVVDIRYDGSDNDSLASCVYNNRVRFNITQICTTNVKYRYLCGDIETEPHLHLQFSL